MSQKVDINKTITLKSGIIGSKPDKMYVTDDFLLFGSTKVKLENIKNIQRVEDDRTDLIKYGILSSNTISGLIVGYTLINNPLNIILFGILGFIIGYIIIRTLRDKPVMYVQLETNESTYKFGLSTLFDASELFMTINENTDINLSYDQLVINDNLADNNEVMNEYTDND